MCTTVALRDVVGKGQNGFVITVVPPHCHFDTDVVAFASDKDRFGHDRGFVAIKVFHKFLYATFVKQLCAQGFRGAFVGQDDPHTGVQKRQFAQALFQRFEGIFEV